MSDVNTGPDAPQDEQNGETDTVTVETPNGAPDAQPDGNADIPADSDTFPRSYVENIRKESAGYRERAKAAEERADTLAKRLHSELVKASNRLENPDDLPFDAEHLDDADKLTAALDAVLADRPYIAKRVVKGDAGQGNRGSAETGLNLFNLLKGVR